MEGEAMQGSDAASTQAGSNLPDLRQASEHGAVMLSARDRDVFLERLDNPPEASEGLRRAALRHRDLIIRAE